MTTKMVAQGYEESSILKSYYAQAIKNLSEAQRAQVDSRQADLFEDVG